MFRAEKLKLVSGAICLGLGISAVGACAGQTESSPRSQYLAFVKKIQAEPFKWNYSSQAGDRTTEVPLKNGDACFIEVKFNNFDTDPYATNLNDPLGVVVDIINPDPKLKSIFGFKTVEGINVTNITDTAAKTSVYPTEVAVNYANNELLDVQGNETQVIHYFSKIPEYNSSNMTEATKIIREVEDQAIQLSQAALHGQYVTLEPLGN